MHSPSTGDAPAGHDKKGRQDKRAGMTKRAGRQKGGHATFSPKFVSAMSSPEGGSPHQARQGILQAPVMPLRGMTKRAGRTKGRAGQKGGHDKRAGRKKRAGRTKGRAGKRAGMAGWNGFHTPPIFFSLFCSQSVYGLFVNAIPQDGCRKLAVRNAQEARNPGSRRWRHLCRPLRIRDDHLLP